MKMKTSASQVDMIVTHMEQHGDISRPEHHSLGRVRGLQSWEELALNLNRDRSGVVKTTEKWKKVWSDFKNNTKRKIKRNIRQVKLSQLEMRALTIMYRKLPERISVINEDPDAPMVAISDSSPANTAFVEIPAPTVKIESVNEDWTDETSAHSPTSTPQLDAVECSSEDTAEGNVDIPEALATAQNPSSSRPSQHQPGRRPRSSFRRSHMDSTARMFTSSDMDWRRFKIKQHNDQLRMKEMSYRLQREWQGIARKALDILDKCVQKL